jgi:branched-subunit amino acid permease
MTMWFVLGSVVLAGLVTVLTAKRVVRRSPGASPGRQVMLASLGFPALAVVVFAAAVAVTLLGPQADEPGGSTGMVVFAMVFFLVYALVIGAAVGIPTAIVAVRSFRNR